MVCIIEIQSACAIWDELIKKACDHEQKNHDHPMIVMKLQLENYSICFVLHFNFINYITRCIWNNRKNNENIKKKWELGWTNQRGLTLKVDPKIK